MYKIIQPTKVKYFNFYNNSINAACECLEDYGTSLLQSCPIPHLKKLSNHWWSLVFTFPLLSSNFTKYFQYNLNMKTEQASQTHSMINPWTKHRQIWMFTLGRLSCREVHCWSIFSLCTKGITIFARMAWCLK